MARVKLLALLVYRGSDDRFNDIEVAVDRLRRKLGFHHCRDHPFRRRIVALRKRQFAEMRIQPHLQAALPPINRRSCHNLPPARFNALKPSSRLRAEGNASLLLDSLPKMLLGVRAALRNDLSWLATRIPGALSPCGQQMPRLLGSALPAVDRLLGGGFPLGSISECSGAASSGWKALALSLLAEATQEAACVWHMANLGCTYKPF